MAGRLPGSDIGVVGASSTPVTMVVPESPVRGRERSISTGLFAPPAYVPAQYIPPVATVQYPTGQGPAATIQYPTGQGPAATVQYPARQGSPVDNMPHIVQMPLIQEDHKLAPMNFSQFAPKPPINVLLIVHRVEGKWGYDQDWWKLNPDEFLTWYASMQQTVASAPTRLYYLRADEFEAAYTPAVSLWEEVADHGYFTRRMYKDGKIGYGTLRHSNVEIGQQPGYTGPGVFEKHIVFSPTRALDALITGKIGKRLDAPIGIMHGKTAIIDMIEIVPKSGTGAASPKAVPFVAPGFTPPKTGLSPLSYRPQGTYYLSQGM